MAAQWRLAKLAVMKSSVRAILRASAGLFVAATLVGGLAVAPASARSIHSQAEFDKTRNSTTKASSAWVVVNKQNPLSPKSYVPKDLVSVPVDYVYAPKLRKAASAAVVKMFKAYKKATGKKMQAQSAYRSYSSQKSVYNGWVDKLGQKKADLTSARPGYSEHQTGLAIDISAKPANCTLKACFAKTSQGKWLAKNAWKYGFILRYPKYKTGTTGYEFEPWHYRYVGKGLAKEMRSTKTKTLEDFFETGKAPTY